jgi:hypothetical protein
VESNVPADALSLSVKDVSLFVVENELFRERSDVGDRLV